MQAAKKKLAIAASSFVNDCCFEIDETSKYLLLLLYCPNVVVRNLSIA